MSRKFDEDADKLRVNELYKFEDAARSEGYKLIAGVDEAGRGSLVGPVMVAAVILPPNFYIAKLDDSKKISAKVREKLFDEIKNSAIAYSCVEVSIEEIDTLNVYQATLQGMIRAVENLPIKPDLVLTDAMKVDFGDIDNQAIIHGDRLSASIAAASIIAKVTRDRLADEWSKIYPQYGFDKNRGYGTKLHLDAIKNFGETEIHRRTFNPVKSMLENRKFT
ncbi:MAG: ribonuclease HII [Selenomonadaceae bacterium]|nr:ribonuclease HII [Selenomonadaceae bacterium]